MLNFPPALAFNGCFASGAGIHPWIATGRAWTGASDARIGHTPFHLLTKSFPVSGNPELKTQENAFEGVVTRNMITCGRRCV